MENRHLLAFLVLLLVSLVGCSNNEKAIRPSGKTIKIGIIGPMSGEKQAMGQDSMEGIQTARLMKPYLENGTALTLIVEDDQNIPKLTIKSFKKLVTEDKVSVIILLSNSACALAVNSIADDYRVPILVLLATHPKISKNTQFVTQLCFDNTFQGKVAALFVRDELLIDRVAVFKNPDSFYSSSLADEFIREYRSIEGEVREVISVNTDTVNFEKTLARLQKQSIQLLYLPIRAKNVIEISRELQKINWNLPIMGSDGLLANALAKYPEESSLLDGFFVIDLYTSTLNATPYTDKVKKFFKSRYQTRGSTYPAAGFEGLALLMDAMNRCTDSLESKCINNQVRNTKNFKGLMGQLTIQANGKTNRPLIVNRITGRRLKLVVKVY